MEQDHSRDGTEQPDAAEEAGYGNERVSPGETHPRESVGGHGCDEHHQDAYGHGDQNRIPQSSEYARALKEGAVVVQRELARIREGGPPPTAGVCRAGPELSLIHISEPTR